MDGWIPLRASDRESAQWRAEHGIIQVGSTCPALWDVLGVPPFAFRLEGEDLHAGCFIPTKPETHGAQK